MIEPAREPVRWVVPVDFCKGCPFNAQCAVEHWACDSFLRWTKAPADNARRLYRTAQDNGHQHCRPDRETYDKVFNA